MRKFSIILILIGLCIASIPLIGKLYISYNQDKLYKEYLSSIENKTEILNIAFEDSLSKEIEIKKDEDIDSKNNKSEIVENVIGTISIPPISCNQLLIEGCSSKQLRYGAGHIPGTALPGELGNCAIAAHRNYTFGSYFNRLGEIKEGDLVNVTYNNITYTYSVFEIITVLPDEISVLNPTETSTVTLITCAPKGSNTHRLIVKGQLIS